MVDHGRWRPRGEGKGRQWGGEVKRDMEKTLLREDVKIPNKG